MTFFSDPSHLWLAVLVMAGTGILCTGVFVFAVKVMLGRFFAMAQSMLCLLYTSDAADDAPRV